ncbi:MULTISPECIES: alpha/beta hydrolase-fold protein [unclassified Exiguobacterium]|uniref:alpha/beta hydrolase n=1 Tax=unclassified Exiguobacterium TaxID=2644629 RepID=UPI001BED2EA9|nr:MULTISPECIES: alpha/beta hydrolase-fold protein [unclassified Exiguobacterium]
MIEHLTVSIPTERATGQKRIVRVFRPDWVEASTPLPVLYMHDGQNVFSGNTATYGEGWEIDRCIDTLRLPLMVVAIASTPNWLDRYDEYSYAEDEMLYRRIGPELAKTRPTLGGRGRLYTDWLMHELKPRIDKEYATNPEDIGVIGSSMGGVISLYMMATYPSIRRVGSLSTAAWANLDPLIREMKQAKIACKLYMDIGTNEESGSITPSDYLFTNAKLIEAIAQKGIAFRYEVEPDAIHHESAWRRRLPNVLRYLYDIT